MHKKTTFTTIFPCREHNSITPLHNSRKAAFSSTPNFNLLLWQLNGRLGRKPDANA